MNKTGFKIWSIIGIIVIILMFFQFFIMTKQLLYLFFLILISIAAYFGYRLLGIHLEEGSKVAKYFMYGIIGFHFLPLLFQLIGVGTPRIDTTITALFGLSLYLMIQNNKSKKKK